MRSSRNGATPTRVRQFRVAVLDTQVESRTRLVNTVAETGIEVCVEGPLRQNVAALIHQTGCDAALLGIDDPSGAEIPLAPEIDWPLVLCSANTGSDMVVAAQKLGAMAFLVKPIRTRTGDADARARDFALP